jgi:hypothetical protein
MKFTLSPSSETKIEVYDVINNVNERDWELSWLKVKLTPLNNQPFKYLLKIVINFLRKIHSIGQDK